MSKIDCFGRIQPLVRLGYSMGFMEWLFTHAPDIFATSFFYKLDTQLLKENYIIEYVTAAPKELAEGYSAHVQGNHHSDKLTNLGLMHELRLSCILMKNSFL